MRVLHFGEKGPDTMVSVVDYQDERSGTHQTCEALKNFILFIPASSHISSHVSAMVTPSPCDLGTQEPMVAVPRITVQLWQSIGQGKSLSSLLLPPAGGQVETRSYRTRQAQNKWQI